VRALFSGVPSGVLRFYSDKMSRLIAHQLGHGSFDAVLCDDIYQVANVQSHNGIPLLLNKASLVFEEVERCAARSRNPLVKAYALIESRFLRKWEQHSCSGADLVFACSERDRAILEQIDSSIRAVVVPNAIDLTEYESFPGDDGRTAVFCGAMDWYPNQDAVCFFASAVLPKLQQLAPQIQFLVAGRNPPTSMRRSLARHARVKFTGTVPDIRPLLQRAAVCVVPLRIGSGTRIKILEAAAMGKAVVSTSIGAEGLQFENGREIILADHPDEFAEQVARLLGDEQLRCRIGSAARRRIHESHTIEAVRTALRLAFKGLPGSKQPLIEQPPIRSVDHQI
jgi:glycosyltransferase involved in cell wall biosynthesis